MTIARLSILAALAVAAAGLAAQNAAITQIDPSRLLVGQENRLYAHLLDDQGNPVERVEPGSLAVSESPDGADWRPAGGLRLTVDGNKSQGIAFLFLMDNSGSMYDDLDGRKTDNPAATRMRAARQAATDFLLSLNGPNDSAGVAVFNTRYRLLAPPGPDRQAAAAALDGIERPARAEGYTELYAAVAQACGDLRAVKGRKALVVLSDGQNYYYGDYEKGPNPQFGDARRSPADALDAAVRQGWTVFAVNFGPEAKDGELASIARQSGGEVFEARDGAELASVYRAIRDRILTEILVEYRAAMLPGDKRWVRLDWRTGGAALSSTRYYYVGTVFGKAFGGLPAWIFLALPAALAAWLLLARLRFEKPSRSANLALLYAPGAGRGTKCFAMGDQTVIGADATADLTIAGDPGLAAGPVTIARDTLSGRYTLVSSQTVSVNNNPVTTRLLEPGDVINFNGTIVVFDDKDRGPPPRRAAAKGDGRTPGKGTGKAPGKG